MKIGILTFHKGYNHGGFFQAFATMSFLKNCGYDAEIIDYSNKVHRFNELRVFLLNRWFFLNLKNLLKFRNFHKDLKHLSISPRLTTASELSKYDCIIFGSDIIWNYEWDFLGRDPIYFGNSIPKNVRLVSYAPSFGNVKYSADMTPPQYVVKGLKRFSAISVRDKNSAQIVERYTGNFPEIVVDPTLLIEKSDYRIYSKSIKMQEKTKYLLVYAFKITDEQISEVKRYASENGLVTISVGYSNKWCNKNLTTIGPFDWLSYFEHAECVVTSTFHGTLFAIISRKPFVTLPNDLINSKLETILLRGGLQERVVGDPFTLSNILNQKIDYDIIEMKMREFRENSRSFLLRSIK
ncbi:MAG: hypothetical protein CVV41_20075 [Candidatus Riflebacteria bacterium HGW-Riflebacteria-1]|jgi:hypothetical protein|nr:MAG: hypothetical protein CVV41_20075 [Candidatus Riflebacteria bacterium HGW-Riflebacteria-1]